MPQRSFNDAKHWRDRAAEMRAVADGYTDNEAASIMNRLADDYDKMADRADDRDRPRSKEPSAKRNP